MLLASLGVLTCAASPPPPDHPFDATPELPGPWLPCQAQWVVPYEDVCPEETRPAVNPKRPDVPFGCHLAASSFACPDSDALCFWLKIPEGSPAELDIPCHEGCQPTFSVSPYREASVRIVKTLQEGEYWDKPCDGRWEARRCGHRCSFAERIGTPAAAWANVKSWTPDSDSGDSGAVRVPARLVSDLVRCVGDARPVDDLPLAEDAPLHARLWFSRRETPNELDSLMLFTDGWVGDGLDYFAAEPACYQALLEQMERVQHPVRRSWLWLLPTALGAALAAVLLMSAGRRRTRSM